MHRHFLSIFVFTNKLVGNNLSLHANARLYSSKSDVTKHLFLASFTFWRIGKACKYLTGERNSQHAVSDIELRIMQEKVT